jgi:hypothetical protein
MLAASPLLLMLNQEASLLPWLTHKRRYFLPFVATAALLEVSCLSFARELVKSESFAEGGTLILGAIGCLPSLFCSAMYLWHRRRYSEWWLLFTAPLLLPPLLLTSVRPLRLLSGGALMAAVIEGFAMRHVQSIGAKLI